MGKFDSKTGALVNPDAPFVPSTIADAIPELAAKKQAEVELITAEAAAVRETIEPKFSMADVMALLAKMNADNRAAQAELVKELRKPTDAEAKKLEDERLKTIKLAELSANQAKLDEAVRTQGQANCPHKRQDNSTALVAQVNSDGYARFFCTRCFKPFPKVKAPDDWKTGGVQTQAAEDVSGALRYITAAQVLAWHKGTVPNCTEACCTHA